MRVTSRTVWVFIGLGVVLLSQFAEGFANGPPTRTFEGQAILARHCAKCHAIDNTSDSVLQQAPPLRDIFRRYPLERLEFELSEGIGSTHPDMPQIQFSTEQIDMIVKYLAGLNGTD